jgi:hypothetical protein
MKNSEIKKRLEKKGWSFKVYASGNGYQAEKGSRKVVGTSWTNLFSKL